MLVYLIIEIYPKKEVLNPETEAVKKSLLNLGFHNIKQIVLSNKIYLTFYDLSEEKCLNQAEEMCKKILVNSNIQEYKISIVKE